MKYSGLTNEEVKTNRTKYGTNSITKNKKNGFFKLLIESLSDPIIKILLIALIIKIIFLFSNADWYETIGIFIAIFLASLISSLSEYGSEKAFERMESLNESETVKVIREGNLVSINVKEVVVEDIVVLESGDRIPADGKILEGEITVDESALTGETIEKTKNSIDDITVYKGTTVYNGKSFIKVSEVGDNTFYGTIAKEIQKSSPESPLKIRLRKLAKVISNIGYISAFLVVCSYLFKVIVINNNYNLNRILNDLTNYNFMFSHLIHALTLAVTIIVVAVPEGLPMMVALVLSSNMKRMLKSGVLVRKLVGIETAGSLNILFTDKTGTLTRGEFKVVNFIDGMGNNYSLDKLKNTKLYQYFKDSVIYNTSSSIMEDGTIIGGNITEKALINYVGYSNKNKKIIKYVPFNSKDKYSYVTLDDNTTYIKGAREKILPKCDFYLDTFGNRKNINKTKVINIISEYEKKGNRIICFCKSSLPYSESSSLTLIGFTIIKDEVRENVKESIKSVNEAGINVVMVTGDNKDTAVTIAKELGIVNNENDIVITSKDLNEMNDEAVKKIIPHLKVVARLLPQDKSRLIKLASELGLVVGMTGDGVNDAPALKIADVGFGMGSGTEVAKEASDIVIVNNDFSSIANAILFGRTIFKSIRKFIIFQLTVNLCAVTLSIVGPFIGIETPVTVIQMLWINMVMDTLAGLAYAYEPPLKEYMKEYPKKKDENVLNKYMISEILFTGVYSALLCIIFLKHPLIHRIYRIDNEDKYLMTAFFGLFIFTSIFNSFNARTHRLNLLSNINKNKVFTFIILFIAIVQWCLIYYGGSIFRTTGLTFIEFDIMLLMSFSVIPVDLIRKIFLRFLGKKGGV